MNNSLSNFVVLALKPLGTVVPFIISQNNTNKEISLIVYPNFLLSSIKLLKEHIGYQYNLLSCISGCDLALKQYRFLLSYELLSIRYNSRLRVKVFIDLYSSISSITNIFINSNWWEREIWDLFGIFFINHPDLRRILTDYGFEGHPLRKDFPLVGFQELRYDNNRKCIIYESVSLSQEFRSFNFETCW